MKNFVPFLTLLVVACGGPDHNTPPTQRSFEDCKVYGTPYGWAQDCDGVVIHYGDLPAPGPVYPGFTDSYPIPGGETVEFPISPDLTSPAPGSPPFGADPRPGSELTRRDDTLDVSGADEDLKVTDTSASQYARAGQSCERTELLQTYGRWDFCGETTPPDEETGVRFPIPSWCTFDAVDGRAIANHTGSNAVMAFDVPRDAVETTIWIEESGPFPQLFCRNWFGEIVYQDAHNIAREDGLTFGPNFAGCAVLEGRATIRVQFRRLYHGVRCLGLQAEPL